MPIPIETTIYSCSLCFTYFLAERDCKEHEIECLNKLDKSLNNMKHKDINVGAEYIHRDFPGVRYLGIQVERKKYLVVIDDAAYVERTRASSTLGQVCVYNKNNPDNRFWSNFVEIPYCEN